MKLCRYDDCADGYYPVEMPWTWIKYRILSIKYKIINYLDKDTKHAKICKLIHRHKKPITRKLTQKEIIIEGIGSSWNCVRCGEKQEFNLMISDSIIAGAEPYENWAEYVRVVDIPTPIFNVPPAVYGPIFDPEPTNLKSKDENQEKKD